jgi:hypothetical protein
MTMNLELAREIHRNGAGDIDVHPDYLEALGWALNVLDMAVGFAEGHYRCVLAAEDNDGIVEDYDISQDKVSVLNILMNAGIDANAIEAEFAEEHRE